MTNHERIPSGVIVMWSGSIKNIPTGWLLCDGTKGTPDLRERFVLGTAENSEIGDRGGHKRIKLDKSQLAPHSHTGNTAEAGDHTHMGTTDVNGSHTHTGTTNIAGDHTHMGTTDVAGAHTHTGTTNVADRKSVV